MRKESINKEEAGVVREPRGRVWLRRRPFLDPIIAGAAGPPDFLIHQKTCRRWGQRARIVGFVTRLSRPGRTPLNVSALLTPPNRRSDSRRSQTVPPPSKGRYRHWLR